VKRDLAQYVNECLTYKMIKGEHQWP